MNKIRMNKNIGLVVLLAGLSACVTINIYFPAAAAEKAADKIIEEVWQLEEGKNKPAETPETKSQTKPEIKPEIKPEAKPADVPAK